MFLSMLDKEKKDLFCNLAYNIVIADGIFDNDEKRMIESYSSEIGYKISFECMIDDYEDVIERLARITSLNEKRCIVFECIGLAMIDSEYAEKEKMIIHKMLDIFNISYDYEEGCIRELREYFAFQKRLNCFVFEDRG